MPGSFARPVAHCREGFDLSVDIPNLIVRSSTMQQRVADDIYALIFIPIPYNDFSGRCILPLSSEGEQNFTGVLMAMPKFGGPLCVDYFARSLAEAVNAPLNLQYVDEFSIQQAIELMEKPGGLHYQRRPAEMVMRVYVPMSIKNEFPAPPGFYWFDCSRFKDEFNGTTP